MARRVSKVEPSDDKKIDRVATCINISRLITSLSREQAKLVFAIVRPNISDTDITKKGEEIYIKFDMISDDILVQILNKVKEFVAEK